MATKIEVLAVHTSPFGRRGETVKVNPDNVSVQHYLNVGVLQKVVEPAELPAPDEQADEADEKAKALSKGSGKS